jgi:ABC-type uncharacterized transport system YnjBCD substrate-binding protein
VIFHQFQPEQVSMTSCPQDHSIWSAKQGQLPVIIRSTALDVNIIGSSNAYLAVPGVDRPQQRADAYKVINVLSLDEAQLHMLQTMDQYYGTDGDPGATDERRRRGSHRSAPPRLQRSTDRVKWQWSAPLQQNTDWRMTASDLLA